MPRVVRGAESRWPVAAGETAPSVSGDQGAADAQWDDAHRPARLAQAGQDYIDTMKNAQTVFRNMAATYQAAGRTVTEADAANERMFRGRSE